MHMGLLNNHAAMSPPMSEIVSRLTNGPIRKLTVEGKPDLYSIYDFMNNSGVYPTKSASSSAWTRLSQSEIKNMVTFVKFPGPGQKPTPTIDARGILKLVSLLGERFQRAYSIESQEILDRYLDGDATLCDEVTYNRQVGPEQACANFVGRVESLATQMAQEEENLPETGFVYGTVSAAFPGMVKIGRTKDMNKRLQAANTFSAPAPHVVIAIAPSFDYVRDERLAHEYFKELRREGEFFEVTPVMVQEFFMHQISARYNNAHDESHWMNE